MPTPEQIALKLRYRGHNTAEINDQDRAPEGLVLATLADIGPVQAEQLRAMPWWQGRERRFRCALDRLFFQGDIQQTASGWIASERPTCERKEHPAEPPRKNKESSRAAPGLVQRSLF